MCPGLGITVDGDVTTGRTDRSRQLGGVAARAKGGVDDRVAGLRIEEPNDLLDEYRLMGP